MIKNARYRNYEKIDRKKGYSELIIEDMYLEEILTFISLIIEIKNYLKYSFEKIEKYYF